MLGLNSSGLRRGWLAFAGQGSARVAAFAQQLLEHSLLTELQGVVARTLQGNDMFTQHQLAGILGHTHAPTLPHTHTLPASHTQDTPADFPEVRRSAQQAF